MVWFVVCVLLAFASDLTGGQVADDDQYQAHVRIARAPPKCMKDLGCFPITWEFFHALYRPVNLIPVDREIINTKFLVYTLAHPKQQLLLKAKDINSLEQSGFDSKKKTKIIVHGWIDNQWFGEWMKDMKDEFLLDEDQNVIIVDWSGGNTLPYTQATANTRVVGAEIAFLLNWLKESDGLKLEDVHILGHSLGAHIAGYAGEKLDKLGRITAMDPAEPYFQNLPAIVRLDPTDADFVDVIHTDSVSFFTKLGLGMNQLVGHVDFFPNNGEKQPGCNPAQSLLTLITGGIVDGARSFVACNHQRAVDFARHSINQNKCVFTGYVCPSWELFLQGKCADCGSKGEKCAYMGEKATQQFYQNRNDTRQEKFYVMTSDKPPFCLFHYQVTVKLANTGKTQDGTLELSLRGNYYNNEIKFKLGNGEKLDLYPGSTYVFLITTKENLGEIVSATFGWDGGRNWIIGGAIWGKKTISLETLRILPMNSVVPSVRSSQTRNYCASKKSPLRSREELTLYKDDICGA